MQKILSNVSYMESNDEREYGYFLFDKEDGEYQVELEEKYVYIPDLGVRVHYGYCMNYNNDTNQYDELSHDVYVVFDINKNEVVHKELQSSICECIWNYLYSKKNMDISLDNINNLKCEVSYII